MNCRAVRQCVCKHRNWNVQGQAVDSGCEGSRLGEICIDLLGREGSNKFSNLGKYVVMIVGLDI